jgi:ankyrin repeat protein
MTELFNSIENRNFKGLERLINAGADINAIHEADNYTPLTFAIDTDNIKYVNRILKAKPDINRLVREPYNGYTSRVRHFETPLQYALRMNARPHIVKSLLKAGADPNIHSRTEEPVNDNRTPLILAIQNGNKEIIKRLLAAGANVNDTTSKGYTPLYAVAATYGNNKEITLMLLEAGANQNTKINNKTALEYHKAIYESNKPYYFDEYSDAEQKEMKINSTYGQHLAALKIYTQRKEKKQKMKK